MDLNSLHPRNEVSLALQDEAGNAEERRAYRQFVHDLVRIQIVRQDGCGSGAVCCFYDTTDALGSWPSKREAK